MYKIIIPSLFFVLGSSFLGIAWFVGTAVFTTTLLIFIAIKQLAYITVPEMEVGVVFRRNGDRFMRFLAPGRHWIRPFTQECRATIPMNPSTVSETCYQVQTSNGLAVDIEWSLAYNLDPFQIKADSQAKLARTLPRKSGTFAAKHVNNVLRHIVGQYSIEDLYASGVQSRLERQIRQQVTARLSQLGFKISRVMIGAINVPPQVQATLEAAHEQRLQTEQEVIALERLHQVISRFSETDMQRLMELERIQKMGRNGVTLMYAPHAQTPVTVENRRSQKAPSFTSLASQKPLV